MQNPQVKRALFAVSDAAGAVDFAAALQSGFGVEIHCEPALADTFAAAGVEARAVDLSQSAESLLESVDLLVANLPDFDEIVLSGANFPKCVQSIELSRAALMRAAAKRFAEVALACSPEAYADLLQELADNGGATLYETRIAAAHEAFQATSDYDYDIAAWLGAKLGISG